MNELTNELRQAVEAAAVRLHAISEAQSQNSAHPGQWSAKEILGHLIDSAANNHQRFVRAQFSDNLVFQGYDQEGWVRAQHYDQAAWSELVRLWEAYNLHLAHVIAHIPEHVLKEMRVRHSLDQIGWQPVRADVPTNLEYLIRDYIGHMREHLAQIFAAAEAK